MSKDTSTMIKSLWGDVRELKKKVFGSGNTFNTNITSQNDWVSVTQYGAKANGITDSTVGIQNALNSGAKTILFPQGIYLITSTLKVNSNTTLLGYGATLLRDSSMDNMMRNNADGIIGGYTANENIKILGLAFNGNRIAFATQCTLLAIGHARNIEVKDCEFYNIPIWHGIELSGVENTLVDGCSFHDGTGQEHLQIDLMGAVGLFPWFGPYDNTPCRSVTVTNSLFYNGSFNGLGSHSGTPPNQHLDIAFTNNTFRNFTNAAIGIYNYKNLTVSGNTIDNCTFGITGFGNNPVSESVSITNNVISNIGTPFGGPIKFYYTKNLTISNNTINKCLSEGILVGLSSGVVITGNVIKDCAYSTITDLAGINVDAISNAIITNNVVLKDPTSFATGVKTITVTNGDGASTNVLIENNIVSTQGTTTVFPDLIGTGIVVGSNYINNKVIPFINSKIANYTYTPTDSVLNFDTSAGDLVLTVNPAVFNKTGLKVRKTSADINTVTITPSSGTINGLATLVLTTQNQTADIQSDWINLNAIVV